jgi:hypothetical protein
MDAPKTLLLVVAVIVTVVAVVLAVHQLGEAKDRWVAKYAAKKWMQRFVSWGRRDRIRGMLAMLVVAVIGALVGAIVGIGAFMAVRAQIEANKTSVAAPAPSEGQSSPAAQAPQPPIVTPETGAASSITARRVESHPAERPRADDWVPTFVERSSLRSQWYGTSIEIVNDLQSDASDATPIPRIREMRLFIEDVWERSNSGAWVEGPPFYENEPFKEYELTDPAHRPEVFPNYDVPFLVIEEIEDSKAIRVAGHTLRHSGIWMIRLRCEWRDLRGRTFMTRFEQQFVWQPGQRPETGR